MTRVALTIGLICGFAPVADGQSFQGQVVDARSKREIARLPVELYRRTIVGEEFAGSASTDAKGWFLLATNRAGEYQIKFGSGGASVRSPLYVVSADTTVSGLYPIPFQELTERYPMFEFQVTEKAVPLDPVKDLQLAYGSRVQVTGTVLMQVVIDTLGVPVPATFKALQSPDTTLTELVRAYVNSMRFRPARFSGIPVHQVFQQPFRFMP